MAVTHLYLQIPWAAFIEANVVGHKNQQWREQDLPY